MVFRQYLVHFKQQCWSTGWDLWCFENASFSVGFRLISAGTWAELTELAAQQLLQAVFPKANIYLHNLGWH